MKVKIIDYGLPYDRLPVRAHYNDAGADVYATEDIRIYPNNIVKMTTIGLIIFFTNKSSPFVKFNN